MSVLRGKQDLDRGAEGTGIDHLAIAEHLVEFQKAASRRPGSEGLAGMLIVIEERDGSMHVFKVGSLKGLDWHAVICKARGH